MQNRIHTQSVHPDLIKIIHEENLGSIKAASKLTGGRLHEVFSVETTKGQYVVKLLNPSKITSLGCAKYELFEQIASSFKNKGINAVPSLIKAPKLLSGGERYYLLYPYQNGKVINGSQMNIMRAKKLGILVGKMHQTDLSSEIEIEVRPHNYPVDVNKWQQEIDKSLLSSLGDETKAKEISEKCKVACATHQTSKAVISHGDMDLGNIIWDDQNDDPFLIDWEYAGKFDVLYDLVNVALYASETTAGNFDSKIFAAVMEGYASQLTLPEKCSIKDVSEAIYLALAGWMRWIDYNRVRLQNSNEKEIAIQQIEKWSKTVLAVYEKHDIFVDAVISVKQKQQEISPLMSEGLWSVKKDKDLAEVANKAVSPPSTTFKPGQSNDNQ